MEIILIILILLFAVVVSSIIAKAIPLPIPLPLIQIVVGMVIAYFGNLGVELNPEIFFLLFLPPLLFFDAWRLPKTALVQDRWPILTLALGLVIFTVLGLGTIIYFLIPAMPLGVAYALAAVISPTDPIAVSAIAKRIPVPKRLMHILEGEALLNDASGLVSMNFAIKAVLTGSFSLMAAFNYFMWSSVAGLIIGALVALAITWGVNLWARKVGIDTGSQILISLLIPFVAYLGAEQLSASGILAAVAAGLVMSYTDDTIRNLGETRITRYAVWQTMQFSANGIIFVLLGEQLPDIISDAASVAVSNNFNPSMLIIYILVISLVLIVLRYLWVWLSLRFVLSRALKSGLKPYIPNWRLIAATSVAGVRGAVTLAGVLTFPLVLDNGMPFPGRDIAICVAAGVIIVSLLLASFALPVLLKNLNLPPAPSHQREQNHARAVAAEAAIKAVEEGAYDLSARRNDADIYTTAAARVMAGYRARLELLNGHDQDNELQAVVSKAEIELKLRAIKAERKVYINFGKRHQLSEETVARFIREIDLIEARYLSAID